MSPLVIAIDGPAGSGKSTLGRAVAARLGLEYLDTGAMYRAATFAVLRAGVALDDVDGVAKVAAEMDLTVGDRVVVDGIDVTQTIRGPEVSAAVSAVATNSAVRAHLVGLQRDWVAARGGGVVEGRDIASVVFPDAALKLYLTASPLVRAQRRAAEHGTVDDATIAEWAANLAHRDHADSTRADSPLTQVDGAVQLDTSDRSVEELVDDVVGRLS